VGDEPLLGGLSDEHLTVVVESDDTRREPRGEHVVDEARRAFAK
jgi:hypothetical protein